MREERQYLLIVFHGGGNDVSQPLNWDDAVALYRESGGEATPGIALVEIVTYWEVPEEEDGPTAGDDPYDWEVPEEEHDPTAGDDPYDYEVYVK